MSTIETIEARLNIVRLWDQNKILRGEAIKKLIALGMTREEAIAYLER